MRTLPISSAPHAVRASLFSSGIVVVTGARAWKLGEQLVAQLACERKRALYLCGDNRFNPYAVARFAKSQEQRPEEVLARILVARAFTAYQLDELIHRLDGEGEFAVTVISGICAAFLDEDVAPNDAARLFYRSLWRLTRLSRDGRRLLLTESATPGRTARSYFLTDLCRASNAVIRLEDEHSFTLEQRSGRPRLPDAAPQP